MGSFVTEHEVLRWGVIVAFVAAAGIVLVRHVAVPVAPGGSGGPRPGTWPIGVDEHESDAAHLLMCLVMLAMLLFPAAAAPDAIRAVLIAMIVVYAGLSIVRIAHWRITSGDGGAEFRLPAVVYHLVAAAAMLWVMAGHHHGMGHAEMRGTGGPPVVPVAIVAALFALDGLLLLFPRTRTALRHSISHPAGAPGAIGAIPHVVMDLGTAYMLIAAVA
ncbi:DUF5134 domain-containing protein [Nocardia mikamii]|uniref:DUF5134 domain-containing protein n=1 Tax=Nocardia mikamii TaxID=508464 RepID=UPI000AE2AA22|nr:DUF5134 domain-containing protein [Nocardia mikamii]